MSEAGKCCRGEGAECHEKGDRVFINSALSTKATAALKEAIQKELDIEDPSVEQAKGILNDNGVA